MKGSVQSLGLRQTINHAKSTQRSAIIRRRFIKEPGCDIRTTR